MDLTNIPIIQQRPAHGVELQLEMEASVLEQQMIVLIKDNPRGGAESKIGKMFMSGYMWMNDGTYGVAFELVDCMLENKWILAQLIAEEYFEGGEERTPYTLDALIGVEFIDGNKRLSKFVDPFTTYDRPNVTVSMHNPATGETQMANLNPDCPVDAPPAAGFKEIS